MALLVHTPFRVASGVHLVLVDFDNAYQAGGMALTPADLGFTPSTLADIVLHDRKGYAFDYDFVNAKLLAYQGAAGLGADTEVPGATDLSALTRVPILALGTES